MMKVVGIFKPYQIPLHSLINISSEETEPDQKSSQSATKLNSPKNSDEESISNTKSESISKVDETEKICQFKINKKLKSKTIKKRCFKCKIDDCDLLFESEEAANKHFNKDHETVFKCQIKECKLMFMNNENLEKHMKSHNGNEKKYVCPFPGCGKKFTAPYNQKIHYRIHTGEKPYQCQKCGNKYYDRANYKYHLRTSHLDVNANDTCCSHKGCLHSFKTKRQKLMHHDKLEVQCRNEKNLLIKLLAQFKKCYMNLNADNKLNISDCGRIYLNKIDSQIDLLKKKVMNYSIFDAIFLKEGHN